MIQLLEEVHDPDYWMDGCCRLILHCVRFKQLRFVENINNFFFPFFPSKDYPHFPVCLCWTFFPPYFILVPPLICLSNLRINSRMMKWLWNIIFPRFVLALGPAQIEYINSLLKNASCPLELLWLIEGIHSSKYLLCMFPNVFICIHVCLFRIL